MTQHPVITTTAGKFTLEWFPPELQILREEITFHPTLLQKLNDQTDKDVYISIAEIAAHAGVVLDGAYTRDDIINLCGILIDRLRRMRIPLILPDNPSVPNQ